MELEKSSSNAKEPLSKQKIHRKVLDKGVPDDVMPGILNNKVYSIRCKQCLFCLCMHVI